MGVVSDLMLRTCCHFGLKALQQGSKQKGPMSLEPSVEEAAAFNTLTDVTDWADLPRAGVGPLHDVRASLFQLFCFTGTEHPRVLGTTSEADFQEVLRPWLIEGSALTHAVRAQAGLWGRASRVATGAQSRLAEFQAAAAAARARQITASKTDHPKARVVKLFQVVDQAPDEEV